MTTATETAIYLTIPGKPQQRGSKQANARYGRDGKPVMKDGRVLTFAKDDNANSKEWLNLVRDKAQQKMSGVDILRGPVILTARFYFIRPNSHYGTGRNAGKLKDGSPRHYASMPDLSKLLRCIEDGMTGIVYVDDRQIVRYGEWTGKYWTEEMARAEVEIVPI